MARPFSAAQRMELTRQARILQSQDFNQRQIAEQLGVSQPTVSNWLKKRRDKSPQELIAEKIRAELVCCDISQQMAAIRGDLEATQKLRESKAYRGHEMCYYGEWAARLAEQHK